jgi:hypothetical protein
MTQKSLHNTNRSEIERLQVRWEMSDMRCMQLKRELNEARRCLRDAIQVLEQIPAAAWPDRCIEHKDNLLKRLSSGIEDLP